MPKRIPRLPKPPLPDGTVRPLTGAFFAFVIYIRFIMNTPLSIRPVNVRLYVAYMADAYFGPFENCNPGNTFTRFVCEQSKSNPDNFTVLRDDHPYTKMWNRINAFYVGKHMGDMSDTEIIEYFNNARANGIDPNGNGCTGMDIMYAKQRWEQRLWVRYEHKRTGRRKIARMCIVPAMACFGIVLPAGADEMMA